ncbi:cytochrome b-245 chaperone 1-like [Hetaerina americana]|uniref:cytochrome b-245 chaperone 1-like n=1 Tax=Hetaerina americana TaxID=62018 RepID=UPI003A7F1A56
MAILSIKYMTPEKLHISQGPGWHSFVILLGFLSFSFWTAFYMSNGLATKVVYIIGSLFLGLICMDDWEDWVLDRDAGLCTVTRCNWYGRLRCQASESSIVQAKLGEVLAAFVRCDKGLTLVLSSGTTISSTHERWTKIKKKSSTFKKLQDVAKEITRFLHLDRIEDDLHRGGLRSLSREIFGSTLEYYDTSTDPSPPDDTASATSREFINVIFELPQPLEVQKANSLLLNAESSRK